MKASPKDIFVRCDDLESIPALNRKNYEFEHDLLVDLLPKGAKVLQVGSMDGMRIIRLLKARPDLKMTGLEIEEPLVALARKNLAAAGLNATIIQGDITDSPDLPRFSYVICLNNTLAYIPNELKAIEGMKQLGGHVIISVFGEKFTDDLAQDYFKSIGLEIDRADTDQIVFKDSSKIRRYTHKDIATWDGEVTETPIGYFCTMNAHQVVTVSE